MKTICKYYDNPMAISYTLKVEINGGFQNVIFNFLIKHKVIVVVKNSPINLQYSSCT